MIAGDLEVKETDELKVCLCRPQPKIIRDIVVLGNPTDVFFFLVFFVWLKMVTVTDFGDSCVRV